MTISADPSAIDLEAIRNYRGGDRVFDTAAIIDLIAAVEALRKRIAVDGLPCACRFHGVEGSIRVGNETGELIDPDDPIQECALHKALRAREVELVGALDGIILAWEELPGPSHYSPGEVQQWLSRYMKPAIDVIRTVLAATPEEALERARAVEAMRQFIDDFESQFVCWSMMSLREHDEAVQHFVERAAKLDALDKAQ